VRHLSRERGQALVEFSLVAILFFTLIFGIFDGVRLLQSWMTVQHAAREGARYAITGQVLCAGYESGNHREDCITKKSKTATTGIPGGGETGSSVSVSFKYWDYPAYAGTGTANSPGAPCDAVEVQVAYTHQMTTPIIKALIPGGVSLVGRQRMVNEPFGPCS
jgi:Flp pilus assembly protein TadG